ncbi:tail tubular protein [Octadecabacter Antarctic DB virus 2]|nr:tail tubular protein [Octadecabacter Antarctic DB virus 2]
MTINTYATLQTAVADFLNRADLTATVPTFISLAEAGINRDLRHWKMEERAVAEVNSQYSAVPGDWLDTIRFSITSGTTSPLDLISQAELIERRSGNDNTGGKPCFYAMSSGQFEFFPTPDESYDAELIYHARIPALSDSNTTNFLLTEAPDVYLYGALVHSAPYLKEDPRAQTWAAFYKSAIDSLQRTSDKAKHSGSGLRMKIRSY